MPGGWLPEQGGPAHQAQPVRSEETVHRGRPAEPLRLGPGELPAAGHVLLQQPLDGVGARRIVVLGGQPGLPMTSGSALWLLTTAGVPLASASSADSPNVSTGPGAIATSAVASSVAS